jgi:hypothetical protein
MKKQRKTREICESIQKLACSFREIEQNFGQIGS